MTTSGSVLILCTARYTQQESGTGTDFFFPFEFGMLESAVLSITVTIKLGSFLVHFSEKEQNYYDANFP